MNGLTLVQNYLNNRPKVKIESNGNEMMWWTKLPTTNSNSKEVTIFAFYADRHFCQKGREVYISNEKNEIKVKFYVKDGYGKTRNKSFNLKYVDFDSIENIMPGIDKAIYKEKKII
ncbi:hypothetical protein [Vallitalea guaymasensis]|uniref:hypothetical protein n=1 Tax=Vallitalea guaymasensis TaxID=1185412 RepID=UPI00272CE61B|nr:hypothetical protein [Vallitalea guaymasensis]